MSRVVHGDCLDVLATLEAGSIASIVTDPPYGLKFMGKAWDHGVPGVPYWSEVLRVLKPGGYLLAFGGTRTHHRLTCAIEDAGFEIRDCLMWLYGSGFPKGKGCLKPGWEPIVLGRKPGPSPWLNVDGCRIEGAPTKGDGWRPNSSGKTYGDTSPVFGGGHGRGLGDSDGQKTYNGERHPAGRWPANVVLSHEPGCREVGTKQIQSSWSQPTERTTSASSVNTFGDRKKTNRSIGYTDANGHETVSAWECAPECAVAMLDAQSGERGSFLKHDAPGKDAGWGSGSNRFTGPRPGTRTVTTYADTGGAARFFYCSKASASERGTFNDHPTVKPLALMRWLVRLVTPPGGIVLDPFCGSGSTLIAADREGFDAIGIDSDPHAVEIAQRRLTDDAGPLFAEAAG